MTPRPGSTAGTAPGSGAARRERLTVYTDVGPPVAMAFTPENLNKLREVNGLTGDAVPASGLSVVTGWYPVMRATSLAAAPPEGSVTHRSNEFAGTFSGGTGAYRCSGDACSVTLDDRGAPTAMGGVWVFVQDAAAEVRVPDYDHLYFGWWLNGKDPGPYGFQSFAGAAGYAPATGTPVDIKMVGSATYRGAAAGLWATVDTSGGEVTSADFGRVHGAGDAEREFPRRRAGGRDRRGGRRLQGRGRQGQAGLVGHAEPDRARRGSPRLRRRHGREGAARPVGRLGQLAGGVPRRRGEGLRPAGGRDRPGSTFTFPACTWAGAFGASR